MCHECWKQMGSPKIKNEAVLKAVEMFRDLEDCGGPVALHSQFDDWNLYDIFFKGEYSERVKSFLFSVSDRDGVKQILKHRRRAERECYKTFKQLSEDERASALAIFEGYF